MWKGIGDKYGQSPCTGTDYQRGQRRRPVCPICGTGSGKESRPAGPPAGDREPRRHHGGAAGGGKTPCGADTVTIRTHGRAGRLEWLSRPFPAPCFSGRGQTPARTARRTRAVWGPLEGFPAPGGIPGGTGGAGRPQRRRVGGWPVFSAPIFRFFVPWGVLLTGYFGHSKAAANARRRTAARGHGAFPFVLDPPDTGQNGILPFLGRGV